MEIHRYEKYWLAISLLLIVGFIATIAYGAVGVGIQMVDNKGGTVNADALDQHPEFSDPGVRQVGQNEYEAYVVARQFLFEPGTSQPLRVPAHSEITLYVTSADVIHGFEIVGTNVNTMVIPGQVSQITFETGEPGEYGMLCHEYCGAGHHGMEGSMVVVPQDEYNVSAN